MTIQDITYVAPTAATAAETQATLSLADQVRRLQRLFAMEHDLIVLDDDIEAEDAPKNAERTT